MVRDDAPSVLSEHELPTVTDRLRAGVPLRDPGTSAASVLRAGRRL